MKSFLFAVGFLTRLPVLNSITNRDSIVRRSISWYPAVGFLIAGICVAFYYGLSFMFPEPTARVLVFVFLVGIKDAFHYDGLGDWADAMYGGNHPNEYHEIMGDPAMGVMGGLSIIVSILIQVTIWLTLPESVFQLGVLLSIVVSTSVGGILLSLCEPSTDSGLGYMFTKDTQLLQGLIGAIISILIVLSLGGLVGLVMWSVGGLILLCFRAHARVTLDGLTGDLCGAVIIVAQVVVLIVFQAMVHTMLATRWMILS